MLPLNLITIMSSFLLKQYHGHLSRYKLDVEVCDESDSAKFVLWDSALDELVGLTASTLIEHQKKVNSLQSTHLDNISTTIIFHHPSLPNMFVLPHRLVNMTHKNIHANLKI
jgi:hypothetical protein